MRRGAPGCQQLQLVLGLAARRGGVRDHGQPVARQVEGVTGQLDLPDHPVAQPFAGCAVQPNVVPGPPRGETITARCQLPDQVAEAAVGRVAAGLGAQRTDHSWAMVSQSKKKALA